MPRCCPGTRRGVPSSTRGLKSGGLTGYAHAGGSAAAERDHTGQGGTPGRQRARNEVEAIDSCGASVRPHALTFAPACIAWARAFYNASQPFASGGAYVNFMTADEAARVPSAYGVNYARLVEMKRRFDPDNVFHVNQNIAP